MRVRAIEDSLVNAPDELLAKIGCTRESQIWNLISRGREYEVHAIAVWLGSDCLVCIVSNTGHVAWLSTWFFEVIDRSIPPDWEVNIFRSWVAMVIGPPFISESQDAYVRLVEQDREQRNRFWQHLEQQRRQE